MRVTIEPLKPDLCCVTARPSWIERVFGVRGYTERFAALHGQSWLWDGSARRCEPHIADAIERVYRGIEWRPRSLAPPR